MREIGQENSFLALSSMFLLVGHSSPDVDAGKKDEDKSLDGCGEDGNGHEGQGEKEGDDGGNDQDEQFFGEDIAEKTDRKGDRTGEMADDFDGEEERSQKGNGAGEMFEIFKKSLRPDALPVVVDKDSKGAADSDVELAGWRHKSWHKSKEIAAENEEADGGDHRQIFLAFLADDLDQNALEGLDDELEDALGF